MKLYPREKDKPNYNEMMQSRLENVAYHFKEYYEYSQCKAGWHEWNDWNSYALHNVSELTEDEKKMGGISIRPCTRCGVEMPDSRKGEKNYKSYGDYLKWIQDSIKQYENREAS